MNHFFFEVRGRERIRDLRNEGLMSQAIHRNRITKPNILHRLPGGVSRILRFVFHNSQAEEKTVIEFRSQT
jgi:hypothetical protein